MNWLSRFLLKRIVKKAVGPHSDYGNNLEEIYRIIWTTVREQMPDDHASSLDEFLGKKFRRAQQGGPQGWTLAEMNR